MRRAIASVATSSTTSAADTCMAQIACSPSGQMSTPVVVLSIGPHDRSRSDVYASLLAALDLDLDGSERAKPPCCEKADRADPLRDRLGDHGSGRAHERRRLR